MEREVRLEAEGDLKREGELTWSGGRNEYRMGGKKLVKKKRKGRGREEEKWKHLGGD